MNADDGLRKAIAREYAEFEAAPHEPESWQLDNGEDFAAAVLALPELAALRAKAAAADRVRELAQELDTRARSIAEEADEMADSFRRSGMLGRLLGMKAAAARIRAALDGEVQQ